MKIKMRYTLLFKNGVKETIIQSSEEKEHAEVIQIFLDSFKDGINAVVTFGHGKGTGKHIRVSDISQLETEILECDTNE